VCHRSSWPMTFEAPKKMLSISGTNRFNRRGSTRQPHATPINRSVNMWPQRETLSSAGRALPNDGAFFLGSHASRHVVGRHSNGAQIARAAARPNFHTAEHRNTEVGEVSAEVASTLPAANPSGPGRKKGPGAIRKAIGLAVPAVIGANPVLLPSSAARWWKPCWRQHRSFN